MSRWTALPILLAHSVAAPSPGREPRPGHVRMVTAQLDPDGRNVPAYEAHPNSLLVFTADMHFIEVLTDADVPRFASGARGHGTDAENRRAMAGGIGFSASTR